ALLEAKLRDRDNLQIERMKRFLPLARTLAQAEDELSLITMLLDDYYQQSLHAPPAPIPESEKEDLPPTSKKRRPRPKRRNDQHKSRTNSSKDD
ncbi:MAG TPA: ATP-dependent helicase, partial [Smithella sp.]|nr:ATP-dependent helicase [Smithella sp.]